MGENAILIILAIAVVGAFLATRSGKGSSNSGSSSTPQGWAFQYSPGMGNPAAYGNGGTMFTFPSTDGVHYLVKYMKATKSLHAAVQVDATNAVFDFPRGDNHGSTPAGYGMYFQRSGDSMTGDGPYEYYRWWSTKRVALAGGTFDLVGDLSNPAEWISVYGKSGDKNPAEFAEAVANMGVAGLTFGGGSFYGHGVFVPAGTATFKMTFDAA